MTYEIMQERFAERLVQARAERNLNIQDFSELCGFPPSNYFYYTKRGGIPNLYTTMLMLKALNMSLEQFMDIEERPI